MLILGNGRIDKFMLDNLDLYFQQSKNIFVFLRDSSQRHKIPFHTIGIDTFSEGSLVAQHLLGVGSQRIVFFATEVPAENWQGERLTGIRYELLRQTDSDIQVETMTDKQELAKWIKQSRRQCGIVVENDKTEAKLIDFLHASGLHRGESYKMISFDNDPQCQMQQLNTIAPALDDIGNELGLLTRDHIGIDKKTDYQHAHSFQVDHS